MINPIGTFLTHTDAALTGSMGGIISYMTSSMATPVTVLAIIYYAVQGLRLANGDPEPLDNFVPQLIRVGTVIWLSSNLNAFNQWVTNIFFTGLPNALATAIGNGTGNALTGLNGTAAAFDNIWAQVWIILGNIWGQASLMSATGIVAALAIVLVAIFGFGCLVILVLVYECARLLLAVLVCLAPAIIGCALFDVTRPIFERAMGKAVALILLQTAGLVVMQIVLMGDQWFVAQAVTASFNQMANNALTGASGLQVQGESIQILIALPMWFFAGAVAMYNLPALAYSIGAGISMRGPPLLRLYQTLRPRHDKPPPSGGGGGGGPPPPPNLTISPRESGGGEPFVPLHAQPPPPPLHLSTRR
jgi:type IV secretory pathway VirB6-like protein